MKTRLLSPKAAATLERLSSFKVTPEVAAKVAAFEARQSAARAPIEALLAGDADEAGDTCDGAEHIPTNGGS